MRTKRLLIAIVALFGLLLTSSALLYAQPEAPAQQEEAPGRKKHCIARAEQLAEGFQPDAAGEQDAAAPTAPAPAPEVKCFATFDEAFQAATGATTKLPAGATAAQLTEDTLAALGPTASTIIGIDYRDSNYRGAYLIWYVNNSVGCVTGYTYGSPTAPLGWNDVVSSHRSYGGCYRTYLFEHAYYGGAVLRCNWCSSMGAMNDRTSSWLWYRDGLHY